MNQDTLFVLGMIIMAAGSVFAFIKAATKVAFVIVGFIIVYNLVYVHSPQEFMEWASSILNAGSAADVFGWVKGIIPEGATERYVDIFKNFLGMSGSLEK